MRWQPKILKKKKKLLFHVSKITFWFTTGVILGLFLLVSFTLIFFQNKYGNTVYPGVTMQGINFGGKTQNQVRDYFLQKNNAIKKATFTFTSDSDTATLSANIMHIGFNADLIAQQAMSVGRSQNFFSNITEVSQAYINGLTLPISYTYGEETVVTSLSPMLVKLSVQPVDALFAFENGKVTAFKPSIDGQGIDKEKLLSKYKNDVDQAMRFGAAKNYTIPLPVVVVHPTITTDKANSLGIKELIASGTSLFQHSIEGRIYNVELAASKLNGILVKPAEEFSFDKALGDVSQYTGYKQAYVIQNGKTVLGDGGGVCQVSTTFFRALLNAGVPITERHAHAYRVGYYEEDSPPGLDATIYVPSVDLKFKNDTGHSILIQTVVDPNELRLTFNLYGTKDNRQVTLSEPVITSRTPAPPPSYQNDPSLPKGQIKQVDFSADGANVVFTRTVVKDEKTVINEKYTSNYQPWQAVYLRGTKE